MKSIVYPFSVQQAGSFCLTEPTSGTDAFGLKTVAVKDGDDFLISGSKMWISNSDIAEVFIVFANADPSKKYRGITAFLVDRNTPGLTVGKKVSAGAAGAKPQANARPHL